MVMKLNALGKCLLGLLLALICGIALACVIIGWINIWWQLDEYMRKSKEDAEQLIQEAEQLIQEAEDLWPYGLEAEDLISWLDQGAEGDGEWNPNRQMTQQIVDCNESGDF